ncbi:hypothetical protein PTKIN_Ptkin09bG0161300 [Pterospermum kingtungense]
MGQVASSKSSFKHDETFEKGLLDGFSDAIDLTLVGKEVVKSYDSSIRMDGLKVNNLKNKMSNSGLSISSSSFRIEASNYLQDYASISVKLQQLTKKGIDCGVCAKRLALSLQKKNPIIDGIGKEFGGFTKLTNMNEKTISANGESGFGVIEVVNHDDSDPFNLASAIARVTKPKEGYTGLGHNFI